MPPDEVARGAEAGERTDQMTTVAVGCVVRSLTNIALSSWSEPLLNRPSAETGDKRRLVRPT